MSLFEIKLDWVHSAKILSGLNFFSAVVILSSFNAIIEGQ